MWLLKPAALCWVIWEERNRRLFEGKERETRYILDASLARLYSWMFMTGKREGPPFRTWIYDWDFFIFHD